MCGSYVSPPLSFPSPLKLKTWVIFDFWGGGAQAPWGQVGSIFTGGRCWDPFGCVLGGFWSLVGIPARSFGARGLDFGSPERILEAPKRDLGHFFKGSVDWRSHLNLT